MPFHALTSQDYDDLVQMLYLARGQDFAQNVDRFGSTYECQAWTRGQLAQAWALPAYNPPDKKVPIPYYDFYTGVTNTGPGGLAEDSDARVAAKLIASDLPAPLDEEPAIMIGVPGLYMLLEGYLRSVLFMRSSDLSRRLLVWVPV